MGTDQAHPIDPSSPSRTAGWRALAASVFEHSREGMLISDADNRIVAVNPGFLELTGYSEGEVLGRNPGFLHSGRHGPDYYDQMWGALRNSGFWQGEIWDRRKSGESFLALFSISVVRDGDGKITHHIGICSDLSRFGEARNQLEKMAHFDTLTALPNRNLFNYRLQQSLATAQRENQTMALVFLDLDGFKPINDRYGHAAGDRLLVEVANRLGLALRTGDTVARLGGDEFVFIISRLKNLDELDPILLRLLGDVAAPCRIDGHEMRVSASIGVTVYPLDGSDPDTLLRHADQAMYQAKQNGRNRYHLYDAEQDRRSQARRDQVQRLRQAIPLRELDLHYQPKVNLRTGRVVGMEALLRWHHPECGLLPPEEFLPPIDNNDLIIDIGRWVMGEALSQMKVWRTMGMEMPVSVNIAGRHLRCADFKNHLKEALACRPEVSPGLFEIEILESSTPDDLAQVRETVVACQEMGVRIALDDFGTGSSSLAHLRHVPSDTLKIDRSFVSNLLDDAGDLTLVESVIGLGAAFSRQVVAEGVETPEHGVILLRLGCDVAQGYGIAHPMPAGDVPAWVGAWCPDPQWALWADTQWEMADFPLLVAQYDHLKWVRRVVMAVSGGAMQLTAAELNDHRQCRFGHWYYGYGSVRYGKLAEFQAIEPVHLEVHRIGPEIMRLKDSGERGQVAGQVRLLLASKDKILDFLNRLQRAVAHRSHTLQ